MFRPTKKVSVAKNAIILLTHSSILAVYLPSTDSVDTIIKGIVHISITLPKVCCPVPTIRNISSPGICDCPYSSEYSPHPSARIPTDGPPCNPHRAGQYRNSRTHWEMLLHHSPNASLRMPVAPAPRRFVFGFSIKGAYGTYRCSIEQKRHGVLNCGHVWFIPPPTPHKRYRAATAHHRALGGPYQHPCE
jgi:hypothetical protein